MAGLETEDRVGDRAAPGRTRVSVVVPAYNAEAHLPEVVPAVQRGGPDESVIVVDAGSTDSTARVAEELGARVIRLPQREGPAKARNVGAREASAEVILFIDSDCVAHPDVVDRVRAAFAEDPDLVSLTGSYDAAPPEPGFFSQYMNLRHHFTHQVAQREPATFWAGCGAVRRDAFLRLGGFDAERFPRPQIEDIELGQRLGRLGKSRLDPDMNVTHLKRWTARSVVETDVLRRAVPWSRLILESGEVPNDLNLRSSQRIAAAIAPLALLAPLAAIAFALGGSATGALASLALIGFSVALNRSMLVFFAKQRGLPFAVAGWAFHQVHLFYSAATFAVCTFQHHLRSFGARSS